MLLAILFILTLLMAGLIYSLRRARQLEKILSEILLGVVHYIHAPRQDIIRLCRQISAGLAAQDLPYNTILPFGGDFPTNEQHGVGSMSCNSNGCGSCRSGCGAPSVEMDLSLLTDVQKERLLALFEQYVDLRELNVDTNGWSVTSVIQSGNTLTITVSPPPQINEVPITFYVQ